MKTKKWLFLAISLLSFSVSAIAEKADVSAVAVPGKNAWPTKEIPAIIPEYKGKVVNLSRPVIYFRNYPV